MYVYVMWKQSFLLSGGSRKPFNLLMCNCSASWAQDSCAFHILWQAVSMLLSLLLLLLIAQLTCFFAKFLANI